MDEDQYFADLYDQANRIIEDHDYSVYVTEPPYIARDSYSRIEATV